MRILKRIFNHGELVCKKQRRAFSISTTNSSATSYFTGFPFERSEALRRNLNWQYKQLSGDGDLQPKFSLAFAEERSRDKILVEQTSSTRLKWLSSSELSSCFEECGIAIPVHSESQRPIESIAQFAQDYNLLFLGVDSQERNVHFSVYTDKLPAGPVISALKSRNQNIKVASMRNAAMDQSFPMSGEDQCVLGVIHSLTTWARNLKAIGEPQGSIVNTDGGWSVQFKQGKGQEEPEASDPHEGVTRPDVQLIYPRVDPVIMALIVDPFRDRILLCRKPVMDRNRFTCVAGFMEVGESIEDTVAREVGEEVGLSVHDIKYVCSQPWPFGPRNKAQLMIGCMAVISSEDSASKVMLDDELEEAYWFSKSEVQSILHNTDVENANKVAIPARVAPWQESHLRRDQESEVAYFTAPSGSIAHTLLQTWSRT